MLTARSDEHVDVAIYDFGGDGPPLLFAHATGFHAYVWLPIAELLADRFHCYGFDTRGHGDSSDAPGNDYHWSGFARDALAVVEALGLDQPYAVGHSSGGALLLLAEESRPGTFRSLYCYEPIVIPSDAPMTPSPENPLAIGARKRRETFPSRDAAYENYAGKRPFDVLSPAALRAYVDYGFDDLPDGTARLKCRGADEARMYEMSGTHGAYTRLHEIGCPVTLACGEYTDAFGLPVIELLAARVTDVRVDVLAGLGHFGPLEDPIAVSESIARGLTP